MERSSQYHHRRTNQGSDRVELGLQHGGNFHDEDVAHHAAADSGQHTEQRRRNRPGVKRQRLTRTRHRKERQFGAWASINICQTFQTLGQDNQA